MGLQSNAEIRQINDAFEHLKRSISQDLGEENLKLIEKAFIFANKAHAGVKRKSGEPYILHPIAVATIVTREIGLGTKSIIASILHDVVEDTDYTLKDISNMFGETVSSIVDGLTKLEGNYDSKQAANFKKMMLTLSNDVRVILIKLADRLHNMRTLESMPNHKQLKIAGETLTIFAPLAHRLGLYPIKTELEDLSLKYKQPEAYNEISIKLRDKEAHRQYLVSHFTEPLEQRLRDEGHEVNISSRPKSVYSIWKKMQVKKVSFDEIYDLLAMRIVFKPQESTLERQQAYSIFTTVTEIYKYKPERIRDWITMPKANGYEALHTTVMGPEGKWVEVQIRSERMDDIAEHGFASHWKYKNKSGTESELDKWILKIKDALQSPESDALDFLDEFKMTLYSSEIVVFTPKGEMKTLPKGSTVVDLAYEIHTQLGNRCIGAKINHELVAPNQELKSGDQVEILTSTKQVPQASWFYFVVTAKAKQGIKDAFKLEHKEHIIIGKQKIEIELKKINRIPEGKTIRKLLDHFEFESKDQLYANIGSGLINLPELSDIYQDKKVEQSKSTGWRLNFNFKKRQSTEINPKEKFILDEQNIKKKYQLAPCCYPIPGDDVIGFIEDEGTVTVHKRSCNLAISRTSSDGDRIVTAQWNKFKINSFLCMIAIRGIDRVGILTDVSSMISRNHNINMKRVTFDTDNGVFTGNLMLYVFNIKDLEKLIAHISKIKGIETVDRIEDFREN